jgi:hypothetical protein
MASVCTGRANWFDSVDKHLLHYSQSLALKIQSSDATSLAIEFPWADFRYEHAGCLNTFELVCAALTNARHLTHLTISIPMQYVDAFEFNAALTHLSIYTFADETLANMLLSNTTLQTLTLLRLVTEAELLHYLPVFATHRHLRAFSFNYDNVYTNINEFCGKLVAPHLHELNVDFSLSSLSPTGSLHYFADTFLCTQLSAPIFFRMIAQNKNLKQVTNVALIDNVDLTALLHIVTRRKLYLRVFIGASHAYLCYNIEEKQFVFISSSIEFITHKREADIYMFTNNQSEIELLRRLELTNRTNRNFWHAIPLIQNAACVAYCKKMHLPEDIWCCIAMFL